MAKTVAVTLFDVKWDDPTPPLRETLQRFDQLPLDQRWREDVRLDNMRQRNVGRNMGWYLDFAKRRDIGPGALGQGRAIRAIRLAEDEDFGEETAALYVPAKGWLLVLVNGNGIGPNRMMQYLSAVDPGQRHLSYRADAKIDAETMTKFRRMRGMRTVEIDATVDALTAADRAAGTSLGRATGMLGGYRVSITVHANEKRHRDRSLAATARDLVSNLLGEDDGVDGVHVSGHDPVEDKDIALNLLKHKLRKSFQVEEHLVVTSHRYTLESRWALLAVAFDQWNRELP